MNAGALNLRKVVVGMTVAALAAAGLVVGVGAPASAVSTTGPAPIEQRNAATVTNDPLPTVQIDSGVVWAQVIAGDTVYAGGSFSNARPAGAGQGTSLMPRSNILAYNINTGVATSFAPVINGTVKAMAVSPDGGTLYVGGSFTQVDGQSRFNVAAFSTVTGALLTTFKPAIGGSYVNGIVATDSTVYFGGLISAAGGVTRKNFAAAAASDGAVLTWAPTTDLQVDTMVLAPAGDKIIAGGRFEKVNDITSRGLAALDLTNGSLLPWAVTATVKNGLATGTTAGKAGISQLNTDSTGAVYGTGWVFANAATGNLEGIFAAEGDTGAVRWIADCHGDHYGVYSDGTNVYSTGHEHDCQTAGGLPQGSGNPGNMKNATVYTAAVKGTLSRSPSVNATYADWSGYPAPAAVNWYADWLVGTATGQGQAGWTATGNGQYLLIGGEFPLVNNIRSQGIARFAVNPVGGAKQGPRLAAADWTPTAKSVESGSARVQIPANWDRDDLDITYQLWAQGGTQPLATRTASSTFWNRPTQVLSASGFEPGSSQTFYVMAKDGDGNSAKSADVTVTISGAVGSTYATSVLDDSASLYWRFGTSNAVGGADVAGANNAVTGTGVGTTSDDALVNEANGSATFGGTSSGLARTTQPAAVGLSFATELWFKTSTLSGGKLVGYGSATSGSSSNPDRHLYMRNNGALVFGIWQGMNKTIESPGTYRDNLWHHAVAQLSPTAGMQLYVDGALVASDATATASARPITGYWRVGGDTVSGWPGAPSSSYFNGRIDEFAVYPATLTAAQVSKHYALGAGLALPAPSFAVTGPELAKSFDGSATTAPAGRTIVSYQWAFGDGATATGATAGHVYAEPGTYSVTLTVKDSANFTASSTQTVTATPPHQAPIAAFTPTVAGLTAAFDASASTASGAASITGHSWDFGDGGTSAEAAPSHTYAAAGTYTTTLTVTDNLGFSSTVATSEVTVSHANPVAAFTSSTVGLDASVDASTSSASDSATMSYSWNWGDGSPAGSGVTASHTYATSGVYPVTLTVTDSLGASATKNANVSVAAQVFAARDDFQRTLATGWGSAVTGGAWSGTAAFSVSDGVGRVSLNAGQTRTTTLTAVSAQDVDATAVLSADKLANGGGLHVNLAVHKSTAGEYRLKVRTLATGAVSASLTKLVGTTESTLATKTITGYTYAADAKLRVHLLTSTAGGSTVLKANVWADGTAEQTGWLLSATDGQSELQGAGQVGVITFLSGSATNTPVSVSVDDLKVLDTAASAPPVHADPAASFTTSASDLVLSVDGSGSTASNGATLAYAWNWGDGTPAGSGATASHTYAAAGTYPVTLTLTDSLGGSATTTQNATVTAHVHPDPVAAFTAAVTDLGLSVDAAGSTSSDGATLSYAWNWGDGTPAGAGATASHNYAAPGTYTVTLTLTDNMGGSAATSQPVTVTAPPVVFVARDDFERSVPTGWGSAITGGAWGTSTGFSVSDGVGKATLSPAQTRTNLLTSVSAQNVDARLQFSSDVLANGGGLHMNYLVHKSAAGDYRLKLRISAAGVVIVSLAKVVGTTETLIVSRTLTGYTHTPGGKLQLRLQAVTAGGSTALTGKVWADGAVEPTDWFVSTTDATPELQSAGQVGVQTYLSGSATNAPVTVSIDNVDVR
ncbi:PKD domain-containing protein [Micromonospora sp. DT81.3]|uniref:PKD domain-containing protein n=1 Tax=Micromonospora sp. DT81.3 TaxID=3416523 RepID=UPI003CE81826